jgi:hypothetical protein
MSTDTEAVKAALAAPIGTGQWQWSDNKFWVSRILAEHERMAAELAEVRGDALRYRWLRDTVLEFHHGRVEVVEFIAAIAYGDSIDAAIDLARKGA